MKKFCMPTRQPQWLLDLTSVRNLTDHRNITGLMGTYVQPQKDPERRFTYFSTVEGDLFFADVTERMIDFRGQRAVLDHAECCTSIRR
jgi:hypothetical protein